MPLTNHRDIGAVRLSPDAGAVQRQASTSATYSETGSGGAKLGGSPVNTVRASHGATGGAKVGGSAVESYVPVAGFNTYNETMSGGAKAGGSGTVSANYDTTFAKELRSGLLAYYYGDSQAASGVTLTDQTGNSRNGAGNNITWDTTGGNRWVHDATTDYVDVLSNAEIPTTQITIVLDYQKSDSTARAAQACGPQTVSALTDRCHVYLPFNDGNLYFDFGGATANSSRAQILGLTNTTARSVWVFSAGPRGMEIWRDGVRLYHGMNPPPTRTTGSGTFRLGSGSSFAGDLAKWGSFGVYNRQVSEKAAQTLSASTNANPVADNVGGSRCGGTAGLSVLTRHTASGGGRIGGSSDEQFTDSVTGSGGMRGAGTAVVTVRYVLTMSGGAAARGEGDVGRIMSDDMSGGVVSAASAMSSILYVPESTGGVAISGAAAESRTAPPVVRLTYSVRTSPRFSFSARTSPRFSHAVRTSPRFRYEVTA